MKKLQMKTLIVNKPKIINTKNALYFYDAKDPNLRVVVSQYRKPFHFPFSFDLTTEKIEEVNMKPFMEKGVWHFAAPHDKNKVYIQARNTVHASMLFKKYLDEHLKKMQDEKVKNESDTQLPS